MNFAARAGIGRRFCLAPLPAKKRGSNPSILAVNTTFQPKKYYRPEYPKFHK
jgi:hypothetical protein